MEDLRYSDVFGRGSLELSLWFPMRENSPRVIAVNPC